MRKMFRLKPWLVTYAIFKQFYPFHYLANLTWILNYKFLLLILAFWSISWIFIIIFLKLETIPS